MGRPYSDPVPPTTKLEILPGFTEYFIKHITAMGRPYSGRGLPTTKLEILTGFTEYFI